MIRLQAVGLGLILLVAGSRSTNGSPFQEPSASSPASAPIPSDVESEPSDSAAVDPLRPLNEGPVHESFLSPRKDVEPRRIAKSPPPALIEHPAIASPNEHAIWIEGYWEWDDGRKGFVWATGSWRVPPPGRFWVNGFWKHDDEGWYRVPGFWSDRQADRIDYRKKGPPTNRPNEDPGEPPASGDCFYIPGQYYPEGDGVVWRKGFWTKVQPGWSWVPASWIRQPEGWIFQEGYWDRALEDRGILFAPAVAAAGAQVDDLVYEPYTVVSPEIYGQLYGAFGRPNPAYDGYPGVYYNDDGRFYGYADYGRLASYYGYLDYPFYGSGYPYYAAPLTYETFGGTVGFSGPFGLGFGSPMASFLPAWGNVGWGGLANWGLPGLGLLGLGWGWSGPTWGSPAWGGFGWGFPIWGNAGFGYGWSGPAWGSPVLNGLGWGLPFFGSAGIGPGGWSGPTWGSPAWSTFGSPFWGSGGFGWGFPILGFDGALIPLGNQFPFSNTGRGHHVAPQNNPLMPNRGHDAGPQNNPATPNGGQRSGHPGTAANPRLVREGVAAPGPRARAAMRDGAPGLAGIGSLEHRGVRPPPASRPFADLAARRASADHGAGALQQARMRTADAGHRTDGLRASSNAGNWNHAFNGAPRSTEMHRAVARPAFAHNAGSPMPNGAGLLRLRDGGPGSANPRADGAMARQALAHQRALSGGPGAQGMTAPRANAGLAGQGIANPRAAAGFTPRMRGGGPGADNPGFARPAQNFNPQAHSFNATHAGAAGHGANLPSFSVPNFGSMRGGAMNAGSLPSGGLNGGGMRGGMHAGGLGGGSLGSGFNGGGLNAGHMGGGMNAGGLGGGMNAGHLGGGGMNAGSFGGGASAGGFGGGGSAGGFGGGGMHGGGGGGHR